MVLSEGTLIKIGYSLLNRKYTKLVLIDLLRKSLTCLELSIKLWHLIYKLKENEVAGNLLNTLANFLIGRKQIVVLNSQLQHSTPLGDHLHHVEASQHDFHCESFEGLLHGTNFWSVLLSKTH